MFIKNKREKLLSPELYERTWLNLAFFLFLSVIALIVYAPILDNALVCDDYFLMGFDKTPLITDNAAIVHESLSTFHWLIRALAPFFLRPVALAFWLLFSSLFGLNPWPYHIVGVLIHAANAWLIFWLLLRLKAAHIIAIISALLFLLTPIATEPVSWSSGFFDTSTLFFILLSMALYTNFLEGGKRSIYLASLLSMSLGLFSKETALVMIFSIPALDLLFNKELSPSNDPKTHQARATLKRLSVRFIPFLSAGIGYLALRRIILGTFYKSDYFNASTDSFYNLSLTFRTLLSPFNFRYFSFNFIHVMFLFMLLLMAIGIFFVWNNWKKSQNGNERLIMFMFFIFLLSLIPIYSVLLRGIHNNMFNTRFFYMPSCFLLSMITIALFERVQKYKTLQNIANMSLVLLLIIFAVGVHYNNYDWERTAEIEDNILSDMQELVPDPQINAKMYILTEEPPFQTYYWCDSMLQPAVNLVYNRKDIEVLQGSTEEYKPVEKVTRDGYFFYFDTAMNRIRLVHNPMN